MPAFSGGRTDSIFGGCAEYRWRDRAVLWRATDGADPPALARILDMFALG